MDIKLDDVARKVQLKQNTIMSLKMYQPRTKAVCQTALAGIWTMSLSLLKLPKSVDEFSALT